ncbi:LicD family protein [Rossellomorea vietnamensis]|uniref:LicD family protein n=1 Tax=Rossellomorea vietnamensis TaxID=218284 RepID=UPI003D2BE467
MSDNIKKLQDVDLEIVKEVVRICEKYNFTYYMIGGTLLGAIRHKGFIPWDDDIDLSMPRDDYEKFLSVAQNEMNSNLKVVNFKIDPLYQYYITRIWNVNTKVIEKRIGNDYKFTHASIDIFPIDGTPNTKIMRKFYYFRIMAHRALMSLCYRDSIDRERKRGKKEKILLYIMEKFPIKRFTTPYKEKCKIDKLLKKQKISRSENIGTIMGAYRTREIVPKKYFGSGAYYEFEGLMLRGPEMYDEYLAHMYGEYMKLPPEESRKTHFDIIEINGEKVSNK